MRGPIVAVQPENVLIFAAATLPALGFAYLVARAGPARPPAWLTAACLAWGCAVAATGASLLNAVAGAWVPQRLGDAVGIPVVSILLGPLAEELLKACGVVLVLEIGGRAVASTRAGMVAGALTGIGFSIAENASYYTLAGVQAGWGGLARAVYLRGVLQGLNHAAFSAAAGAGMGWGVEHGAVVRGAMLGLSAAVLTHAVWNGLTSIALTDVLCNAPHAGGPCAPAPDAVDLFVTAPLLVLASVGPLALLLGLLARRTAPRR